jgi:hypothetical protein
MQGQASKEKREMFRNLLKALIVIAISWSAVIVFTRHDHDADAQGLYTLNDPTRSDLRYLTQDGRLFNVQIVPTDKELQIFVAGRETTAFDVKNGKVTARMTKPVTRDLAVARQEDHYTITDTIPTGEPVELEVKPEATGKSETFHFKLENRPAR